jgi:hypothetical protein
MFLKKSLVSPRRSVIISRSIGHSDLFPIHVFACWSFTLVLVLENEEFFADISLVVLYVLLIPPSGRVLYYTYCLIKFRFYVALISGPMSRLRSLENFENIFSKSLQSYIPSHHFYLIYNIYFPIDVDGIMIILLSRCVLVFH